MKKKRKALIFLFAVFWTVCFLSARCRATELPGVEMSEFEERTGSAMESFSYEGIGNKILESLKNAFFPSLENFSRLAAMILICAVTHSFSFNLGGKNIGEYVSALCFSAAVFTTVKSLCDSVGSHAGKLRDIMAVISPTVIAATAADGAATAKVGYTGLVFVLDIAELLAVNLVLPCAKMLFVMAVISAASPKGTSIRALSSSLRTFTLFGVSLTMTVIVTVMHFQDVIARAADSIGARAVRFASVSFVPLVGNLVGESMKTVTEALRAVRGVTGAIGVSAVISALLPPVAAVVVYKLEMIFCASLSRILGCDREGAFFSEINSLLNILSASLLSSSIAFSAVVAIICKMV